MLNHYLTLKTKIAFMFNLEIRIAAAAITDQPRLLDRWNLQGGGAATVISVAS